MNLYKEILNNIPAAVIVVDENLRVRYSNRAFRTFFPASSGKGSLKDVIRCGEAAPCGRGEACAFCPLRNLFLDAEKNGGLAFRKLMLRTGEGTTHLSFKVQPLGGLYLGVVDNAYEAEIAREMHSAQDIQQRLLPPGKGGSVPYSFLYLPCREIGGDLPDVYEAEGETMGLLADVSGKGISAGMLSAFVKAGWDRSEPSPARAITGLNAKFQELNLDERSYVTVAAVRIGRKEGVITYCAAGHNAPILMKRKDGIDEVEMNAPPISTWIPEFSYHDSTIGYEKGDILVLLTDGVTESRNEAGEQFSLERVEAVLSRSHDAAHFIEQLKGALAEFCVRVNHAGGIGRLRLFAAESEIAKQEAEQHTQQREKQNAQNPEEERVAHHRDKFVLTDLHIARNAGMGHFGDLVKRLRAVAVLQRADFFAAAADLPDDGEAARGVKRLHFGAFYVGNRKLGFAVAVKVLRRAVKHSLHGNFLNVCQDENLRKI